MMLDLVLIDRERQFTTGVRETGMGTAELAALGAVSTCTLRSSTIDEAVCRVPIHPALVRTQSNTGKGTFGGTG